MAKKRGRKKQSAREFFEKKARRRQAAEAIDPGKLEVIAEEMTAYAQGSSLIDNFDFSAMEISKDRLRFEKGEEYYLVMIPSATSTKKIGFGFRAIWSQETIVTGRYRDSKTGRYAPAWKARRYPKRFYPESLFGQWTIVGKPIITEDRPYPEKKAKKGFRRVGR